MVADQNQSKDLENSLEKTPEPKDPKNLTKSSVPTNYVSKIENITEQFIAEEGEALLLIGVSKIPFSKK